MKKVKKTKKYASPLTVLLSLACVVLVVVTIVSQITLNEKTIDNKNMEIDAEFTVDRKMNENWTVKVFVWNTKEGMNPIIDSVILR